MTKPTTNFLAAEYDQFAEHVEKAWGVPPSVIASTRAELKGVFRRYLALSCAATVLGENAPRNTYLVSLPEAAYLCLILSLKGAGNTCAVLLRQSIELVLKHIYYSTHPTEFGWAQRLAAYREQGFQNLLEYIKLTDEIATVPGATLLLASISDWYARLSRHVHLHSNAHLSFPVLKHQGAQRPDLTLLRDAANELWPRLTLLLCVFECERFVTASHSEKQLIRDCFTVTLRNSHNRFLRAIGTGRR